MKASLLILILLTGCIQQGVEEPENILSEPAKPLESPPVSKEEKPISIQPKLLWSYTTMDNVYGVALSGDGKYAAIGSWDQGVYFLNNKAEQLWAHRTGGGVNDVAITKDGTKIAVLSYLYDETTLHLLDNNGVELWNISLPGLARGVDVSPDGSVAVASNSGKVYLLKDANIAWEYVLEKSAWGAWDVVFADNKIVAGDDNSVIYELNLAGELVKKRKLGSKDYLYGVAADSGGGYTAAVTQDRNVYFFKDGGLLWKKRTEFSNYGVEISSKRGLVAVGSWDQNLYLYDLRGRLLWKHYVGDNVNRLSFSDDGGYLLFGSSDNSAYLFELIGKQ